MRRLCATGLTVLLCVQPLLADGPLTRSADREAARLAAVPSRPVDADGWKAVRLLDPRSAIASRSEIVRCRARSSRSTTRRLPSHGTA